MTGALFLSLTVLYGCVVYLLWVVSALRESVDSLVELADGEDDGGEFVFEDGNVCGMVSLADAVERVEAGRGDVDVAV